MKLEKPINENYAAVVVRISKLVTLEGCDNVVGAPLLGFQAIVSKDTKEGDIGIVFPAETQLSDAFLKASNLYRHSDKNEDPSKKGYVEDNRRVRAMKFRGHRSDCLFLPLGSMWFAGGNHVQLEEGDVFDHFNGVEICRKYAIDRPGRSVVEKNKDKTFKRVESKFMPEHYDTDNFFRNRDRVHEETRVTVTQKLHGTSIRIGNTVVRRKHSFWENLAIKLGIKVQEYEYDYVFGSRKVIKDVNNPNQKHFYGTDLWTEKGKEFEGLLPQGFVLYGELIGWTKDCAAIQKKYTYDLPVGQSTLYVYRIAQVNPQGKIVDLSWQQVKEFCADAGLMHVPELWSGKLKDFDVDYYIDKAYVMQGINRDAVPLSDFGTVDEGVCIRVEGIAPYILKAKSPVFLQYESKMLDEMAEDLEADEALGSEDHL